MPAYIVVQIEVHDPETYERYRALAPASIAKYDGRYLVRGGDTHILEGTWNPPRLVVLEFPTMERAREWWASPEYGEAISLRQNSANTEMLMVEGYTGD